MSFAEAKTTGWGGGRRCQAEGGEVRVARYPLHSLQGPSWVSCPPRAWQGGVIASSQQISLQSSLTPRTSNAFPAAFREHELYNAFNRGQACVLPRTDVCYERTRDVSMMSVAKELYAQERLAGFYRGFQYSAMQSATVSCHTWHGPLVFVSPLASLWSRMVEACGVGWWKAAIKGHCNLRER